MTEQELDDLARRVMLDAARQEYGDLMEGSPEHTFSPAFERKMKKLVRQGDHPLRHKILHAAACLLLVLLLSGCSVLAFSAEAREAFAGWVREVYETSFIYRFSGSNQVSPTHILYRPTYIPSGYQMTEGSVTDIPFTIIYKNDSDRSAIFTCFPPESSPVIQIVRDGTEIYKQITVGGMPAELYIDQDEGESNILIWKDENEGTIFCISGPVSDTELIKMAESVEAVPIGYRLGWVPEGYELFIGDPAIPAFISYHREDGGMILLWITESAESLNMHVDMDEEDLYKQVLVSGRTADLYLDAEGENGSLVWMDDAERLVFMLSGSLTEEELIKIAENVQKAPAQPAPHSPTWLPEGYRRRGCSGGGAHLEVWYSKESGEQILLRYIEDGLAEELQEGSKDLIPQSVMVNGQRAWLYEDAGRVRHLVWNDGKSKGHYRLTGPLSVEELIQIAESVGQTQG